MITFLDGTDADEVLQKWVAYTIGFQRVSRRNRVVVCYVPREEAVVAFNDYAHKQHSLTDGRLLRINLVRPCEGADPITFVCAERAEVRAAAEWAVASPSIPAPASGPWMAEDAAARLWAEFARAGAPEQLRARLRDVLVEAFQAGYELATEFRDEADRSETFSDPPSLSS